MSKVSADHDVNVSATANGPWNGVGCGCHLNDHDQQHLLLHMHANGADVKSAAHVLSADAEHCHVPVVVAAMAVCDPWRHEHHEAGQGENAVDGMSPDREA